MRWLALILVLALWVGLPGSAVTQTADEAPTFSAPILIIDQNRLFAETMFGRASLARLKAGEDALLAENLRIEQGLEAEERTLTEQRAVLPPEEFRALADAFDVKVEGVRAAQRAKYVDLTTQHDDDKVRFLDAARPIIGQLMQERGAVAVMDETAVMIFLQRIEITDIAVARINEAIGDGVAPQP
jgi:Skp family chaperone for outer membrane proteins